MRRFPAIDPARLTTIPLRQGVVIDILDLPLDLTPEEANKIANVVKAMVNPTLYQTP